MNATERVPLLRRDVNPSVQADGLFADVGVLLVSDEPAQHGAEQLVVGHERIVRPA